VIKQLSSGMVLVGSVLLATSAVASDHGNLDDARPLRFEDVAPLPYGARELQFGLRSSLIRGQRPLGELRAEYKVGFAVNRHFELGFDPSFQGGRRSQAAFDAAYFEQLKQSNPDRTFFASLGLAYRLEYVREQGEDHLRTRLIADKHVGSYGRLHMNVDGLTSLQGRGTAWDVHLGFSEPLGAPEHLETTLVAELAGRTAGLGSSNWIPGAGLGIRKQVSSLGTVDMGVEVDFGSVRAFRFVLGYTLGL